MTAIMERPSARVAPALVAGATAVLATGTVVLVAVRHSGLASALGDHTADSWLAGLAFGVIGALLLRDAPGNRLGPLMATGGLLASLSAVGAEVAAAPVGSLAAVAAWAAAVLWLPAFLGLVVAVPLLFPDGHLASTRWRWPARAAFSASGTAFLLLVTTQEAFTDGGVSTVDNPLDLPLPDGPQLAVAATCFAVALAVGLAAAGRVLVGMRRADPRERGRYAWFATAILLALLTTLPLPTAVAFGLNVASFVAVGTGIVRHRLFDIEPVLSRTLVYVVLSAAVLAVYLAASIVVGESAGPGLLPALVASVAAVALARGQDALHQWLRRLLYGDRDDAGRALERLGTRLAAAPNTDDVLPLAVETARRSLRLPYAEILLAGEDVPAASSGPRPHHTVEVPLVHAGEDVGVLRVAPRSGEHDLSARDVDVLERFARQVAVAAHGVRTNRALRRSREQLVTARETERARIHRDLHDGLGPALAGISLGLETASRTAGRGGPGAVGMLEGLRAETAACVDDVRRIVADLRPPALDAGLVAALRQQADLLSARSGGRLAVELCEVDEPGLRVVPPAVEVAAYRIASEAMTNAVRHSGATRVRVRLRREGGLTVDVEDDGCGAPPRRHGTGLTSMRERAEELGGALEVRSEPGRGTSVRALIPLPAAAS